ncbi:4-oxalocrotonate tautomerase [Erwinia toletana]|uniref:4-oxalocrotonate tautomerase n=1 Tax=Winslowiella toletana TaxID=92490 RepID=A0ABS4PGZ0_9GAMM|nr:tautomerase PptA [Winslowiella toletana]MBP2171385.1 4-oxalocrotonate tautomerase [Winslowiella toletana]
MPHIDIKYFPRELSDEEKSAIAEAMADVLKQHFGSKDSSLSVAMTEIPPEQWKTEVYDPLLKPHLDTLVKKPGYEM